MDEYPIFETPFKQTKPMNLSNHFLIAMPSMHDPIFGGTVVYLCEHNDYGALGVVINRPMELTLDHLLEKLNLKPEIPAPFEKPVMFGGPVQDDRGFVLHTPDAKFNSMLTFPMTWLLRLRGIFSRPLHQEKVLKNADQHWLRRLERRTAGTGNQPQRLLIRYRRSVDHF